MQRITWTERLARAFSLRGLSWLIGTVEKLIAILSGPILIAAVGIAALNQRMGGSILRTLPWVGLVWALLQVLGADTLYLLCWTKIRDAYRRDAVAFCGWAFVTLILTLPVVISNYAFYLQITLNYTDEQAMEFMGLSVPVLGVMYVAVLVVLMIVSAMTRESLLVASDRSELVPPTPGPDKGSRNTSQRVRTQAKAPAYGTTLRLTPETAARPALSRTRAEQEQINQVWTAFAKSYLAARPATGAKGLIRAMELAQVNPLPSNGKAQELCVQFRPVVPSLVKEPVANAS